MRVHIDINNTSQPLLYQDVVNTYQKGDFYCVYLGNNEVIKIPMVSIFRVKETNGSTINKGALNA